MAIRCAQSILTAPFGDVLTEELDVFWVRSGCGPLYQGIGVCVPAIDSSGGLDLTIETAKAIVR